MEFLHCKLNPCTGGNRQQRIGSSLIISGRGPARGSPLTTKRFSINATRRMRRRCVGSANGTAGRFTLEEPGPARPHTKGSAMSDRSPRQSLSKKSDRTLKQKRADKRAKAEQATPAADVRWAKQR